ncbi:MAG TPA: carboxypeptidase regulatory-like domain-containing protein, partial [Bryobacteraceae bacterium]|nr:carboxypeptidase regulatory-like domain-containing protein [Bryobacteraceae bacterium]
MLLRCLVTLLAAAGLSCAQSTFGTILGTVTDPSGSVISGARVVITNLDENTTRALISDSQGNYEALNLKAGVYSVSVETPGFKSFRQENLKLDARQSLRVNVALELGQVTEKVLVQAEAPVISTESQTIASTFNSRQVLELPANFRGAGTTSPIRILSYLPGVQSDNSFNYSIQGALPHQTEVSLDGISTVNVRSNGPLTELFPSAESISEMKVQAVGNSAEFGQLGDITTTSRAGSNAFHGSLFEYMQNRAFDATAFGSVTRPQKTANTFGGSVGGRIIRDHTFFFGAFEDMQFRRGTTLSRTVPTQAMRNGDLSREGVNIRNPFTGQPYAGNAIPSSEINPVARQILQLYPLPNFGNPDVQRASNFRANRAAPITSYQYDLRIDHVVSPKQSLFTRWTSKNQSATSPNWLLLDPDTSYNDTRGLVVSHNYTLRPTLLNEFRIGMSNLDAATSYAFDGPALTRTFGFQGLPPLPFNGLTEVGFSGATSNFGKGKPGFTVSRNLQVNDNFTWVNGRHTLKFGADFRRLRTQDTLSFVGSDNYGTFAFEGRFTGSDFADFLLGLPARSSLANVGSDINGLSWHYAFYAQDSFKVSPRLTLEYGLRYEYHPPFRDAGFNITNFDRSVPITGRVVIPSDPQALKITAPAFLLSINACPAPAYQGIPCTPFITAKEAGWPERLRFPDKKNFNPRFGFAYRPFSDTKTVVRGGFGVYTMTILGSVFYSLTGIHGSDIRDFNNDIVGGAALFRWPQISAGGSGIGSVQPGNAYFGTANAPNFADPYTMQWSTTVEREIGWNTGLRLSYIGNRGVKLPFSPDLNQPLPSTTPYSRRPITDRPFPYWDRIRSRDTGANSIYNALQTEVNHRLSSGVTFSSAWTWAKALSDAHGPTSTGYSAENGGGRLSNSLDRRADRGNIGPIRRHRWISTALYELPFGHKRRYLSAANPVLDAIAGGWRLSGIFLLQTGPYLTATVAAGDPSGTNSRSRGTIRPDAIADGNRDHPTADMWFNRAAFVCPGQAPGPNQFNCNINPIGRFGNAGVGTLVGPGTVNLSMGFAKDFRLAERARLTFESTFSNLPNHPNLNDPS